MEYVRLNKANPIYRCIPHRILSSRTHGSIDTVYTGRTMHSNSTGGGGGGHAVVRDDTAAVDGGGGGGVEGSMGRKRSGGRGRAELSRRVELSSMMGRWVERDRVMIVSLLLLLAGMLDVVVVVAC